MLFPPVGYRKFQPGEKRHEVLAVGRFDDGENSKRFDVLIDVFRRATTSFVARMDVTLVWRSSWGRNQKPILLGYDAKASGYPVEFHPNLPFPDLAQRYSSAKLFWHAMGYGVNVEESPWKCEHFGITTAEAMSAGCVPMVINAGGQPEILGDSGGGYLGHA